MPYRLRVSPRCRRMGLRFSSEGLEVVKPPRLQSASHDFLFQRFEGWIRRQIRRRQRAGDREKGAAGRFLMRGMETPLVVRETDLLAGLCAASAAGPAVTVDVPRGQLDLAVRSLRELIFAEAKRDLRDRLSVRAREMDQTHGRVDVRDQKSLWGSCSPKSGTLSFNARLVMAPPAVLDYIVVHELAHFRWSRHGARFWERVARFCPEFRAHRRWLRDNGWRLRLPASTDELAPFLAPASR